MVPVLVAAALVRLGLVVAAEPAFLKTNVLRTGWVVGSTEIVRLEVAVFGIGGYESISVTPSSPGCTVPRQRFIRGVPSGARAAFDLAIPRRGPACTFRVVGVPSTGGRSTTLNLDVSPSP